MGEELAPILVLRIGHQLSVPSAELEVSAQEPLSPYCFFTSCWNPLLGLGTPSAC